MADPERAPLLAPFESEGIKLRGRYCISGSGLLKWMQILFAIAVLALVLFDMAKKKDDDPQHLKKYIIKGEQYTVVLACICVVLNLFFLITFFCNCHRGPCVGCRCTTLATVYYGLSVLMWLAAGGVETYATVTYRDYTFATDYYRTRASASAFCFLIALLYVGSLQHAKYYNA